MLRKYLKYNNGDMVICGWKRCKDEYDLPKRDNEWFKYLLQKETCPYKYSDKE